MRTAFEEVVAELNADSFVRILGFTDKVPELMSIADLVVTKPGGLTTTESLASNLPLVMINPIPGQEEENAEFLEKHGVGVWIKKQDNPDDVFLELLNSPTKLENMQYNTKFLGKPNSTKDICKIIMKEF